MCFCRSLPWPLARLSNWEKNTDCLLIYKIGHLQYDSGELIFLLRQFISVASFLIGKASTKILRSLDLQAYQGSEAEEGVVGS